jgi:hypothetical protein
MTTSTRTGGAVRRATIPSPRPAEYDTVVLEPVERQPEEALPELPEPRYPWPEPWGSARGARPRSEYWDVATASWHSRGPNPKDQA